MAELYKCPLCEVACALKSTLLSHIDKHEGHELGCRKCRSSFKNKFAYDYHLSSELCKKPKNPVVTVHHCPECSVTFPNRRHLNKHVDGHKRNNCQFCDAKPTTRKDLCLHMALEHKTQIPSSSTKYQCRFCERCFAKQATLFNHYHVHANSQFVCQTCGVFVSTSTELDEHKERHELDRPWKCTRCGTTFSRRQQYSVHMDSHEKHRCKNCNMGFAAKATLQQHLRACQNKSGKEVQHECPECGKIFSRESQLKLHLKAHTGEESYTCLVCKESFVSADNYNQHIEATCHKVFKMDDPLNLYECEECKQSFPNDFRLAEHLNKEHGKPLSYKCKYCDHSSNSRANMTRHRALHTERRKYVCDQCGAAFHALTTLKDHCASVHSEHRQFSCADCPKTFKLQSDLRRHIRSHSDTRPFVCLHCPQAYKRASHLRRHEQSTHSTVYKVKKLQRLEQDENGALVPVSEESKSSSSGGSEDKTWPLVTDKENTISVGSQQITLVPTSQDSLYVDPVLSVVDAESGKILTLRSDTQILTPTGAEILTEEQLASLVSCSQVMIDTLQTGDLSFELPQALATVFSEPRVVFATHIPMSLDQAATILTVQSSNGLGGQIELAETDVSKLPDTIFIEDPKLDSMEEPMLLDSTEPAPHITIENFTALQPEVADAGALETMLHLQDEVLSSGSLLRSRLLSGPKISSASLPPLSECNDITFASMSHSSFASKMDTTPLPPLSECNNKTYTLKTEARSSPKMDMIPLPPLSECNSMTSFTLTTNAGSSPKMDMISMPPLSECNSMTSFTVTTNARSSPKMDTIPLPPLSDCDDMTFTSLSCTNSSSKIDLTPLPSVSECNNITSFASTSHASSTSSGNVMQSSNLISLTNLYSLPFGGLPVTNSAKTKSNISTNNISTVSTLDFLPGMEEDSKTNISLVEPLECLDIKMDSPEEGEHTTTTLSALPVEQSYPDSSDTTAISTPSVDALDAGMSEEDFPRSCIVSIHPRAMSPDLVMASLDMHPEPSFSQADEAAIASATLMAEFLQT